jgi:LmbE family N-acetylglucosaminyl deacetylase
MATLVCFHAHPDDESIATGGTMAKAVAEGHRVVLVCATKGEHGEVAEGFLDDGETLGERRVKETHASADVLGVAAVEFLGFVDSGMMGTPENDLPGSFWTADVEEAAERLAEILRHEQADVLTVYDANGNYGHPDHIQVHRVGVRAAELAGVDRVYEATVNRDEMLRGIAELRAQGFFDDVPEGEGPPDPDDMSLGVSEDVLTTRIDVGAFLEHKRASMRSHASQIAEQSFFLAMPEEAFAGAFGVEWYIRHGAPAPVEAWETSLFG